LNDTGEIPSVTTIEDDAAFVLREACGPSGSGSVERVRDADDPSN